MPTLAHPPCLLKRFKNDGGITIIEEKLFFCGGTERHVPWRPTNLTLPYVWEIHEAPRMIYSLLGQGVVCSLWSIGAYDNEACKWISTSKVSYSIRYEIIVLKISYRFSEENGAALCKFLLGSASCCIIRWADGVAVFYDFWGHSERYRCSHF